MLFFIFVSCVSLSDNVDCQSYSIDNNILSFWDSGSDANTGVYFSLSNTGGNTMTHSTSYHVSSEEPGSLFNGYQFELSINNLNTTSGSLAIFISSTQPTQDALALYDDDLDISENINGLGELKEKFFLTPDDYKYQVIQAPATQLNSDMYVTLIVSEDSILEGNLNIDKLYCSKKTGYAKSETSSLLSVDDIW